MSIEPVRGVLDPDAEAARSPAGADRRSLGRTLGRTLGGLLARPLSRLLGWPRRRWVVAAVIFPALVVAFGAAGRQPGVPLPGWAWPAAVGLAAPAALVLASYLPVPGSGLRLEIGCTPCAVAAGGAVLLAVLFRSAAPADPARAALCAVLLGVALHQRLADPDRCPAPAAGPPAPGPGLAPPDAEPPAGR